MKDKKSKIVKKVDNDLKFLIYFLIFSLISGIFGAFFIDFLKSLKSPCDKNFKVIRPKYITHDNGNPKSQILLTIDRVLKKLYVEKIELQSVGLRPENISIESWDLFWCLHHFDKYQLDYKNLKYFQKINHWPGNYALAAKSFLSQAEFKFIPKSFLTSNALREYNEKYPDKKYVQKLKSNRGVKLINPNEIKFDDTNTEKSIFVQEFIHPPLLWNDHKFDFSIFVIITSVNPLRLYYYNKNVNLRFCKKIYSINDPNDVDCYVIGSDFMSAQDFNDVKKFHDKSFTNKEAFEDFVMRNGKNLSEIWWKVDDLIRTIVMSKENYIIDGVRNLKKKFH